MLHSRTGENHLIIQTETGCETIDYFIFFSLPMYRRETHEQDYSRRRDTYTTGAAVCTGDVDSGGPIGFETTCSAVTVNARKLMTAKRRRETRALVEFIRHVDRHEARCFFFFFFLHQL